MFTIEKNAWFLEMQVWCHLCFKSSEIFAKDISDTGLLSKIYKERLEVNNKKTNNLIKNQAEDFNRHLTKRRYTDGK